MEKIPINIILPYRNCCKYELWREKYADHTCIFASVTIIKNPTSKYSINSKYSIKFNSEWIPFDKLEWLGNILLDNLLNTAIKAEKNTIEALSLPIQEFKRLMSL